MSDVSLRQDHAKRAAAEHAVDDVEDGMVVGLGSGSTAAFAIKAIAVRIANGLRIAAIPTSENTAALARRLGVPLTDFAEHRRVDLTIDGADQAERGTLNLVKGHGGSLLREKIVASASDRMIVVVDESKVVERLGGKTPLPVEIVVFGWQTVVHRLAVLGCAPQLRLAGKTPFVTDGGNFIADCAIPTIPDPVALEATLSAIVGVVATGLFIGVASSVVVGSAVGVSTLHGREPVGRGAGFQPLSHPH